MGQNRTTRDITYEVGITERLIDFTKDAKFITQLRGTEVGPLRMSPQDFGRYNSLSVGEWPSFELTDDDLDAAKRLVDILVSRDMATRFAHNHVRLWPRCNFINSISGVPMRGPRKVIEADTSISANNP